MADLSTIRSNIATYLARDDLTAQINLAINKAIDFYEGHNFWFTETSGTFATVADQQAYTTATIPSDIGTIHYVEIVQNSTSVYRLEKISLEELRNIDGSNGTSTSIPTAYAFYANSMYLYPVPNDAYTVRIYYSKSLSDLSADADTNVFTTNAQELIEQRSLWWLKINMLMDYETAQVNKSAELEALSSLIARSTQLVSTNRVRSTRF